MRDATSRGLPRFPALAVSAALLALASLLQADLTRAATAWTPIGPHDVGMITGIAAGRSAVYAATCNGVYRSDDGAASWHEAGLQRQNVVRLAVDPNGDADTLYVIVDNRVFVSYYPEPSAIAFFGLVLGSTLWVSRDGGHSWSNREFPSGHALAVDRSQPGTAYAACYGCIYGSLSVTHDYGTTWRAVPDAPGNIYTKLAVDPRDGNVYAASTFLSTLAGGAWSNLAIQIVTVATGSGPDGTGAVYAAGQYSFCRKLNGGTWNCNAIPQNTPIDIVEIPAQPQGPRERILLLSLDGLRSSDDGGATFSAVENGPPGYIPAAALAPSGGAVLAGNDIGVYRSVDRGATWTKSSKGLNSSWVRALAIDPHQPSTIWAGGEARVYDIFQAGPGLFRSDDDGESWRSVSTTAEPGYVFSLGLDPSNERNLLTASFGKVERSADGGATWAEVGTGSFGASSFIEALAVDPGDSSKVWAAGRDLKVSEDAGQTWTSTLQDQVFTLLFDPRHPGTLYAGESWDDSSYYYPFGSGFAVQTSRDGGATWRRAGSQTSEGAVMELVADPFSDVLYAGTFAGTILRSTDSGATWSHWDSGSPTGGSPIFTLIADPARPGFLYLGGWGGVSISRDGGRTWDPFVLGLEPYGVFGLAISPDGRYLYAGTTGGGVFRRDLDRENRAPVGRVSRPETTREVIRP